MFNYYTDIVWNIDKTLFILTAIMGVAVIIYALLRNHSENKRRQGILNIKKNVNALATLGQKPSDGTCPTVGATTSQQFLDVEMEREQVLFDGTEKQFIRKCFGTSPQIDAIRKMALSSRNKWRRIEAILSMGYAEDTASLGIIKNAALDKDEDVAYYSLLALGLIKNIESAKILLELMKKNIFSPSKIASLLETFPPEIVDETAKMMDDASPLVRFWAINLIAKFKVARYLKKLEELTKDPSSDVRAAACESLGAIGNRESKGALLKCLKDKSWIVRTSAVKVLSSIIGGEAIKEVALLIKDDSLLVREAVKAAMASNIEASMPFIKAILSENDELAKREVIEALEISGYTKKLLKSIISKEAEKKSEAVNLLKLMIRAQAHFGIETVLDSLGKTEYNETLEVLQTIDRSFAEHIKKKARREITEP